MIRLAVLKEPEHRYKWGLYRQDYFA